MDSNNKKVRIIIDSTADLAFEDKNSLTVLPLTVRFGDEEYLDGITIDHETFYHKLADVEELPTTSQATPDAFLKVYRQVAEAGETAVVITISSRLSGTFQSAMLAAQEYPGVIEVVDSRNATVGTGALVKYAMQLAEEGYSARQITEILMEERKRIRLFAAVDTLEYLKKGGRLSSAEAFVGGVLSIKPILTVRDGELATLGKARGSRQASQFLVKEIDKTNGIDFTKPVIFGYTGLDSAPVQKFIADNTTLWNGSVEEQTISPIGSVIGTHAGPGAFAVVYFEKEA